MRFDSVMPESPAEEAGLRTGDRLLKLNDEAVVDLRMYSQILKNLEPGIEVVMEIQRNEKVMEIRLIPTKR